MAILGCLTGSGGKYLPSITGRRRRLHDGEEYCTRSTRENPRREQQQTHVPPPPKGSLAVMVGEEGEEPQRFVVPVAHLSHPLFLQLLKRVEDERGFQNQGPIAIPCRASEFRSVQGAINRDSDRRHRNIHLFSIAGCFGR